MKQLSLGKIAGIDHIKIGPEIKCLSLKTTKTISFINIVPSLLKLHLKVVYRSSFLSPVTFSNLISRQELLCFKTLYKKQIFRNGKQYSQKVLISIQFQVAGDWGLTFLENRRNFKSYSSLTHQCRTLHLRPVSTNRCSCQVVPFRRRKKHPRSGNRPLALKSNYRGLMDDWGGGDLYGISASCRRNGSGGALLKDLSIYDGQTEVFAFLVQLIFIINFGKTSSKKRTISGNLLMKEGQRGRIGHDGLCSDVVVCSCYRGFDFKTERRVVL